MKGFSRNDKILLSVIVVLCMIVLGIYVFWPKKKASEVDILVNGTLIQTCDLDKNQRIPIKTEDKVTNVLVISNHQAYMQEADCPDHLCMKQGKISYGGESIVCLPNRVVIQVVSPEKADYDSVAK